MTGRLSESVIATLNKEPTNKDSLLSHTHRFPIIAMEDEEHQPVAEQVPMNDEEEMTDEEEATDNQNLTTTRTKRGPKTGTKHNRSNQKDMNDWFYACENYENYGGKVSIRKYLRSAASGP